MHFLAKLKIFLFQKYFLETSLIKFNFIFSVFTLVMFNKIFLNQVWKVYPSYLFVSMMFIVLLLLMNMACSLLFFKHTAKPLAILFTLLNAFIFYFMNVYNAAIDRVMLLNVFETDMGETKALIISMSLLTSFFLMGILPSYLIYKIKIVPSTFKAEFLKKLLIIIGAIVIAATIIGSGYKETAQFLRNNKSVKYYLIPVNYVGAAISVAKIKMRAQPKELVKIGEDATTVPYWKDNGKKNLVIFVVGETARAANFSLNGYTKKTNEPLEKFQNNLLSYKDVKSCGTSTAISLPCMFSKDGRGDFDKSESYYTENLLDVVQRAGYKVWWRGNVTGCKGLCNRVESEILCNNDSCFDDVLLKGFKEKLQQNPQNTFVILHQLGSHGPTYYKRYPDEAKKFQPTCNTERLDKCSREEIMNVYDNTLYYTSENLAETIKSLQALSDKYNPILIYVSDHGESLGENNIYLHAAPYAIAPDEQVQVPFLLWLPEGSAQKFNIDKKCLTKRLNQEYSHDNLFHSFLGLMGIKTNLYKPELDMFATCAQR